MTDKGTAKLNMTKRADSLIALLLCFLITAAAAGCAARSDAEKQVAKELDALKSSESVGSEVSDIQKILSKIHGNLSILNGLEKIKSILEKNELPESKKKTEKMIEILKNQRYVSFNC